MKANLTRIAILGAGPIGLEAALYAKKLGFETTVLERGRVGEYWHRWGHVKLFSPFGMNITSLGRSVILAGKPNHPFPPDDALVTGREHVAHYLNPLVQADILKEVIKTEMQVLAVGRKNFLKHHLPIDARRGQQPFHILLRDKQNRESVEEADIVLDCTGTYGLHRWLGDGGIPALGEIAAEQQIVYTLEDVSGEKKNHYLGRNILVVGGGYSAATTVCNLANLAQENNATWIIWLSRGSSTQPIKRFPSDPLKERDRLAVRANTLATRDDANVEFHSQTIIDAVEFLGPDKGFRVSARSAGQERTWEVERVIANLGYRPSTEIYRELQVHECYATQGPMKLAAALASQSSGDCLTFKTAGSESLRTTEPNFFILGSKSFGRNSHFLLRTGFEQVRDVFALITGKPALDLYKPK